MAFLHQNWACSPFFHDFLGLIESSMLVVETNGQRPVRRITAADVKQRMVGFYNRSGSEAAYLSGVNPLNDIPVSTMHHLGNCHSDEAQSEKSAFTSDLNKQNISTTQTIQETGLAHVRRFACPFFKMNPHRHGKTCSRGWEYIHRLK
ncbi:hypothetical protein NW759_014425 [Fusarium solani]|nr:hypothetical protein NW759_014425 [Fusarium solani]